MGKKLINNIKEFRLHHKIVFFLMGTIGVVLIWRGIWTFFETTPVLNHPVASLILGLILVVFSGYFFKLL